MKNILIATSVAILMSTSAFSQDCKYKLVVKLDGHLEDIEAQEKESAEWESNEQTRYDWSE